MLFQFSAQLSAPSTLERPATIELVYLTSETSLPSQVNAALIEKKQSDKIATDDVEPAELEEFLFTQNTNSPQKPSVTEFDSLIEQRTATNTATHSESVELPILSASKGLIESNITEASVTNAKSQAEAVLLLESNHQAEQVKMPTTPRIYSGTILGASKRQISPELMPYKSKQPIGQLDTAMAMRSSSCKTQKQAPPLERQDHTGDADITISALLGGGLLNGAIIKDQHMNISMLLGGRLPTNKAITVAQLLNLQRNASENISCVSE